MIPTTDTAQANLEQFRQLLFHLQMQCGSIHELFRLFKEQEGMQHFEALKSIDPNLMSQLLAREYVLEARKSLDQLDARSHLKTAMQLDPQCPEAFLEMAAISETPEAAMKWYNRSMEFTSQYLGEERMKSLLEEFKAKPWHQVELHTYMKAKVNLAEKLFREGYFSVANLHFKEMLEWDANDEIGIRHFYFTSLLCENKLKEAQALKLRFSNDLTAQWYYCRAFLQYKLEGPTRRSNRLLMRAFKRNLWAAIYGLGLQVMPPIVRQEKVLSPVNNANSDLENVFAMPITNAFKEGGQEEAVECVRCMAPALLEDEGLSAWVWDMLKGLV